MPPKIALITGVLGQDGQLLAEHLLDLNYRVVGVVRPRRDHVRYRSMAHVNIVGVDLTEINAVLPLLTEWNPDEIYHLAAIHHSSQEHSASSGVDIKEAMLIHNFLSTQILAFAMLRLQSNAHLVFAASSQMFTPQSLYHEIKEDSRRNPRTFYGLTKSWSMELLAFLRGDLHLRTSTAILFNHESPLRGPQFVSRKIAHAAAHAKAGHSIKLELLNIGTRVDWSSARDVVQALHLMANAEIGGDFIVASGELHSVRDVLEIAFGHVGLNWREFTSYQSDIDESALVGCPNKIRDALGWKANTRFEDVIVDMVEHDLGQLNFDPAR